MTLTGQSGASFNYLCQFQGIAGTGLPIQGSPELVVCTQTLEAYRVALCSDYPSTLFTAFRAIKIQTGAVPPPLKWTAENRISDCKQRTVVVSDSTTDGEVDIYYGRTGSAYQQRGLETGTALGEAPSDNQFVFLLAPNLDIYVIMKNGTGTKSTEVHVLTAASGYQQRGLETGTALGEVPSDDQFVFQLAPNLDIYAIMKNGTGTKSTEVHVLKR